MILGVDWRGRMTWDFKTHHVCLGDDEWIELQQGSDHHCRRIYVESDTVLAPRQETAVPVRATRRTTGDRPYEAISECPQIPNLSHVYSGRSLLPAKFTGLHVLIVNADSRPQIFVRSSSPRLLSRQTRTSEHRHAFKSISERS